MVSTEPHLCDVDAGSTCRYGGHHVVAAVCQVGAREDGGIEPAGGAVAPAPAAPVVCRTGAQDTVTTCRLEGTGYVCEILDQIGSDWP